MSRFRRRWASDGSTKARGSVERNTQCACATCHVYVDELWIKQIGAAPPESSEEGLLQFVEDWRDSSRLACQIAITDDLDGLVLRLPVRQH